jgi:oligopeptide transport system substrate-binding protein
MNYLDPQLTREYRRQLEEGLGIRLQFKQIEPDEGFTKHDGHLMSMGWSADYPDPDSFLHKSNFYLNLRVAGWNNSEFEELIQAAAVLQDRSKRLVMYRKADRLLVNDEVLVYPVSYAGDGAYADLAKPWVKNLRRDALGYLRMKDIVFDDDYQR